MAINATDAERVGQHIVWINAKSNNSGGNNCGNDNNSDMEPPIIIFTYMKKNTDALPKYLRQNNDNTHREEYKAVSLQDGKSQENREPVFKQFNEHKIDILVCTNVGARGIDVHGINK